MFCWVCANCHRGRRRGGSLRVGGACPWAGGGGGLPGAWSCREESWCSCASDPKMPTSLHGNLWVRKPERLRSDRRRSTACAAVSTVVPRLNQDGYRRRSPGSVNSASDLCRGFGTIREGLTATGSTNVALQGLPRHPCMLPSISPLKKCWFAVRTSLSESHFRLGLRL